VATTLISLLPSNTSKCVGWYPCGERYMWNAARIVIYLTIALPVILLLFIYIANTQARMLCSTPQLPIIAFSHMVVLFM
jgi:hypothetical protein